METKWKKNIFFVKKSGVWVKSTPQLSDIIAGVNKEFSLEQALSFAYNLGKNDGYDLGYKAGVHEGHLQL